MSPITVLNSLPETSGILGMDLPTLMDYKMGHIADIAKTQDFHDGIQLPAFGAWGRFWEVYPHLTPVYPSGEKRLWTYFSSSELEYNHTAAIENTETEKNCRYTYACRKAIADGRPRVRGRFVKLKKFLEKKLK
ncbi:hypothetical protein Peur_020493 [Populus x canadensis]